MRVVALTFQPGTEDDFTYVYGLCERTMRAYVEADLGDCFERVARPIIASLLQRGLFSKIFADEVLVGAVASEQHETHIQLEELYVEPASQRQRIGTLVMTRFIEESSALALPIRLHVLASNGARLFYEGLGFNCMRSTREADSMECRPSNAADNAD